jgi:hypothetical protein
MHPDQYIRYVGEGHHKLENLLMYRSVGLDYPNSPRLSLDAIFKLTSKSNFELSINSNGLTGE